MRPELAAEFGDYPELYRAWLAPVLGEPVWRGWNLPAGERPASLDECDAWIISGSYLSATAGHPWMLEAEEWLRGAVAAGERIVAICFGYQLLAQALGGRVERAPAWGLGVHAWDIVGEAPWMRPGADEIALVVSHRDQVVELPSAARLIAGSAFCPHAAFAIGDRVFALQGHPEFSRAFSRRALARSIEGADEPTKDAALATLARAPDSELMGRWVAELLRA